MVKRKNHPKKEYFEATIKSKDLIKLDIIQRQEEIQHHPATFEDVQQNIGFNFEKFIENELKRPKNVQLPPYGPTKSLLVKRHHQEEIFVIGDCEYRLPFQLPKCKEKRKKKPKKTHINPDSTHVNMNGKDMINVNLNVTGVLNSEQKQSEEEGETEPQPRMDYISPILREDEYSKPNLIDKHVDMNSVGKPMKMVESCDVLIARRFCDTHMVNEYKVDKSPGYFSNRYHDESCKCPHMDDIGEKRKHAKENVDERYASNFEYRYHMQHINQPEQLQQLHNKEHYDPVGIKWYGNISQRAQGVPRGFPELMAQIGNMQDHEDCPCCRWSLYLNGKRLRPKNFVKEIALDVDDFATLRLKWSQAQFNQFIVALVEQQYAMKQSMFDQAPLIYHTSQRSASTHILRVHLGFDLRSFEQQFTLDTPAIHRVFYQKQGFRFDVDVEHRAFDFVQYDHRKRDQFIESHGEEEIGE